MVISCVKEYGLGADTYVGASALADLKRSSRTLTKARSALSVIMSKT
jgi:hypothetical protein